jgi:trehalose 6-phosphate synthase/phosphatase
MELRGRSGTRAARRAPAGEPLAAPAIATTPAMNGDDFPFRRLVVVSNRLPFAVEGSGRSVRLRRTVGGLVSAVDGYLHSFDRAAGRGPEVTWVGWPGPVRQGISRAAVRRKSAEEHRAVPVFLTEAEESGSYEGFCNRTLWPLFHLFPSYASVDDGEWETYRAVNERFCDAVLEILQPGDAVWVHDYHLMLLPAMLRSRAPQVSSAFFLHIPFPPFEVLRVLPDRWSRALVAGVLGAEVVGMHTYDYVRHFLRSAERLLGAEHRRGLVDLGPRQSSVDAYPLGIDFASFDRAQSDRRVRDEMARIAAALGDRRGLLSVDRLDYTKGVLHRLEAFEIFLERHPQWRRLVSLVAIVVPSRVGVDRYRKMKTQIEEIIGRVNGRFGDVDWTPVIYRYRALDTAQLTALYAKCDVALVTPLRDGMNLVAKEYLATRSDGTGVLVLSDTAGAARELGEAVVVNPYHVEGIADGIAAALEMTPGEQSRRNRSMRERLRRYDVVRWGREQFDRVVEVREVVEVRRARSLDAAGRAELLAAYRAARRRLLLLDYDGTLVPLVRDPAAAAPGRELLRLLERLGRDPRNTVVLVSGRDWRALDQWFGGGPMVLVSEHGARIREPGRSWRVAAAITVRGKERARRVMQIFADRLPGSFVEEKESSVAWHYRGADPELGPLRAREITDVLRQLTASTDLQVLRGRKVVEVKPAGANKGTAVLRWITRRPRGFVFAAGDDVTDESLFAVLPASAWSIRVGPGESRARRNVDGPDALVALLAEMAGGRPPSRALRAPVRPRRIAPEPAGARTRRRATPRRATRPARS